MPIEESGGFRRPWHTTNDEIGNQTVDGGFCSVCDAEGRMVSNTLKSGVTTYDVRWRRSGRDEAELAGNGDLRL